jgi:hypothetical protein
MPSARAAWLRETQEDESQPQRERASGVVRWRACTAHRGKPQSACRRRQCACALRACVRASLQLELLNDASPTGSVEEGTVERLTKRWEERELGQAAAAAAASDALLAKYAADAAAQRCARMAAPCATCFAAH